MQKLVRAMGHGLLQIIFIALDDRRIFVRETEFALLVQLAQGSAALFRQFAALVNGLTAAARAPAGTCLLYTSDAADD